MRLLVTDILDDAIQDLVCLILKLFDSCVDYLIMRPLTLSVSFNHPTEAVESVAVMLLLIIAVAALILVTDMIDQNSSQLLIDRIVNHELQLFCITNNIDISLNIAWCLESDFDFHNLLLCWKSVKSFRLFI